ncbi:MAG TPA: hypothetical protein VES60_17320 [Nakamurella sp.]|nr:hypothetical protein [Nakamurella sp.]
MYDGGWCGNDLFPTVLDADHRAKAVDLVRRLGDGLAQEAYLGFFEVDILVDLDADEVYLGELNPRILSQPLTIPTPAPPSLTTSGI